MLCQACTQIFEGDLKLGNGQYHCTAPELRRASENGCQICQRLWTFFSRYITGNNVSGTNIAVGYSIENGQNSLFLAYREGIPADLYILTFFLKTDFPMSMEDEDRSCVLILEPYEGWLSPQPLLYCVKNLRTLLSNLARSHRLS